MLYAPLLTASTPGVKINTHYLNSHTKDKIQSWILRKETGGKWRVKGLSVFRVADECNLEVRCAACFVACPMIMPSVHCPQSVRPSALVVLPASVRPRRGGNPSSSERLCKTGGPAGEPWVMSDEKRRGANQSRRLGHSEVRLPASSGSGKVQPHGIRQISETETGREKEREREKWVVNDENTAWELGKGAGEGCRDGGWGQRQDRAGEGEGGGSFA